MDLYKFCIRDAIFPPLSYQPACMLSTPPHVENRVCDLGNITKPEPLLHQVFWYRTAARAYKQRDSRPTPQAADNIRPQATTVPRKLQ